MLPTKYGKQGGGDQTEVAQSDADSGRSRWGADARNGNGRGNDGHGDDGRRGNDWRGTYVSLFEDATWKRCEVEVASLTETLRGRTLQETRRKNIYIYDI